MAAPATVSVQLKIPLDTFLGLRKAFEDMEKIHLQEFKKAEERIKYDPSQKGCDLVNALRARGRKLTFHNVARYAIEHGMGALSNAAIALTKIAEEGLTRGRPKHAA